MAQPEDLLKNKPAQGHVSSSSKVLGKPHLTFVTSQKLWVHCVSCVCHF